MNTVERFKAVYTGQPVDRTPICAWLSLPQLQQLTGKQPLNLLREIINNPEEIIKIQEGLGLDPIVITVDDRWFSMHWYWRLLYSWPEAALDTWRVEQESSRSSDGFTTYRFTANTPEGPLTWSYQAGNAQVSDVEFPIKNGRDLDLASKYMPAPESLNQDRLIAMIQKVSDRAFFTHNFIGIWGEAANMRGLVNLSIDLIQDPVFVKRLSEFLMERAIRRVRHLAKTGIHSVLYDQSWVGVGYSREQYREFMLPYDREVVKAALDEGLLVSYHNCGRGMNFLEDMVETEAHSLETLTPRISSGDFDLAEVKRRVGDQITLNGGFNERILPDATDAEIRDAVKRCLDAAASGGRYILRTTGQIFDTPAEKIQVFTQAGREYGRY